MTSQQYIFIKILCIKISIKSTPIVEIYSMLLIIKGSYPNSKDNKEVQLRK